MKLKEKIVAITGASSGIGAACARAFARQGAGVSLCARRLEPLQTLAQELKAQGAQVFLKQVDVSQADQVERWVKETLEAFGQIDILVNNAGVGCVGRIADIDMKLARQVFDTNFFGAVHCIQAVVPQMRKRGRGHIVNVSSIIGKRSVPDIGMYCATKFALNALSDAMRLEVGHTGIKVSTVCPGLTETEFSGSQLRPPKSPSLATKYRGQTAEKVAKKIVCVAKWGCREVHLTPGGNFLLLLERLSPWLTDQLLKLRHIVVNRI